MRVFRYFPPSVEEQRAFLIQLIGTLLALVVIGVLALGSSEPGLRGVLAGIGVGVLFLLARTAWQLEKKAARAEHGEVRVDQSGFICTNFKGETQSVPWEKITTLQVVAGKLLLHWNDDSDRQREMRLSTREIEDGLELIQLLATRGRSTPIASGTPSNFIPLQSK